MEFHHRLYPLGKRTNVKPKYKYYENVNFINRNSASEHFNDP